MTAITKRLNSLEKDAAKIRRKRDFIPVLFVREMPEGVYTDLEDNVFNGDEELHEYAARHGTVTIINDNTQLKREESGK